MVVKDCIRVNEEIEEGIVKVKRVKGIGEDGERIPYCNNIGKVC